MLALIDMYILLDCRVSPWSTRTKWDIVSPPPEMSSELKDVLDCLRQTICPEWAKPDY